MIDRDTAYVLAYNLIFGNETDLEYAEVIVMSDENLLAFLESYGYVWGGDCWTWHETFKDVLERQQLGNASTPDNARVASVQMKQRQEAIEAKRGKK